MASWIGGINFHKISKLTSPPCKSPTMPIPLIPFFNIALIHKSHFIFSTPLMKLGIQAFIEW